MKNRPNLKVKLTQLLGTLFLTSHLALAASVPELHLKNFKLANRERNYQNNYGYGPNVATTGIEELIMGHISSGPSLKGTVNRSIRIPFEQVTQNLSVELEQESSVIYLVNTANPTKTKSCTNYTDNLNIQGQHMIVLKRKKAGPLFNRNNGLITSINKNSFEILKLNSKSVPSKLDYSINPEFISIGGIGDISQTEIPVSTGKASSNGLLTFSGIFRLNESRTIERARYNSAPNLPMSYSVYVDGIYDQSNRESGVAIHGTPTRFHNSLGVSRESHGCVRTHPDFAKWNRSFLFDKSTSSFVPRQDFLGDVHSWNPLLQSPPIDFKNQPVTRRLKAIIVLFEGYKGSCL